MQMSTSNSLETGGSRIIPQSHPFKQIQFIKAIFYPSGKKRRVPLIYKRDSNMAALKTEVLTFHDVYYNPMPQIHAQVVFTMARTFILGDQCACTHLQQGGA